MRSARPHMWLVRGWTSDRLGENRTAHLTHYQPWSLVNRWHSELDPLFNDSLNGSEPFVGNDGAWVPSVDVFEGSDCFLVRADIPGVTAKDNDLTADDCVLTIRGER
jgi:HSP20 family protein